MKVQDMGRGISAWWTRRGRKHEDYLRALARMQHRQLEEDDYPESAPRVFRDPSPKPRRRG